MRRALVLATTAALALGLAAGPASGGGGGAGGGGKTVRAVNFDFKPKNVTIQKGSKVTWKNVAGAHTVTLNNGSFNKVITGSETVSKRFRQRGTFPYLCTFHKRQDMRGKVIVE